MSYTIRAAILCRVSTSGQADEGQSLKVQESILLKCVEMLNGTVTRKYIGQEHGTEGHERPILDELLLDAKNRKWDALFVYDHSRLTRDPIKSKIILAELKKQGIKLYVQTQLYSLDNPETNLIMGLLSEINAFQASIQVQKSIESKIELAKKGWLVYGQPPFGRNLAHNDRSKAPEWIIDEDKLSIAHKIYDLYINHRMYVEKLSKIMGMDDALIYRILKDRGVHRQSFNLHGEQLIIETPIPRLFTHEQSELIKERLKSNKLENSAKQIYILRGLVKCQVCGLTYLGFTVSDKKHSYYVHSKHNMMEGCLRSVHRHPLERAVLDSISELISNNTLLLETVKRCNSHSLDRIKTLGQELEVLLIKQDKAEKRKSRIVKLIIDGVLDEADAAKELDKVKTDLQEIETTIQSKKVELESLSETEVPEEVFKRVQYTFDSLRNHYGYSIHQWNDPIKRLLVEWFFGLSKESGVWIKGDNKEVQYTIKSNIGAMSYGWLGDDSGNAGVVNFNEIVPGSETLTRFASIVGAVDFISKQHERRFIKFRSKLSIEMAGTVGKDA